MTHAPFSHVIPAGGVPPAGKQVRVEANPEQRRRLAEAIGIPEILSLAAELDLRPIGDRAFSLKGTLEAQVVRTDVVTLEPITEDVTEEIDLMLRPAEDKADSGSPGEVDSDAESEAELDHYHRGGIDLGMIVGEHLALGLDPYPRAPGVVFEGHIEDDPKADPSPFAALAALKRSED